MEDSNQSTPFPPTKAPPQLHNFMPMPPTPSQADEEEEDPKNPELRSDLKEKMEEFWKKQLKDVSDATNGGRRLTHPLPLARIKKVMKMDEDIEMVSAETTMVFAKACEIFTKELTERSWIHTVEKNHKTLQRDDIARALREDDLLSFLHNTVTMPEEAPDEESPTSEEEEAKDVPQQIYFSEPHHQYHHHAADPFSYLMNTPNMNHFVEGSTSSAAANNPIEIDPSIAHELNLQNISPNFMQIGGEMPPSYHPVAPQPPRANMNPAYMVGGEMHVDPYASQPPPPSANMNNNTFQTGGQMIQDQLAPQPPRANPNAAFRDFWRQQ